MLGCPINNQIEQGLVMKETARTDVVHARFPAEALHMTRSVLAYNYGPSLGYCLKSYRGSVVFGSYNDGTDEN